MIQRIQTIYLLLAAVITAVTALAGSNTLPMLVLLIVSVLLSVGAVFLFRNRPLQARLTAVNMFVLVAWYILLAVARVEPLATGGGGDSLVMVEWLGQIWTDVLPMVALLLLFLARKGIVKDEKLVRSLDRIR